MASLAALFALANAIPAILAAPVVASPQCNDFMVEVPVTNAVQLVPPFPALTDDGYGATSLASMLTYREMPQSTPKLQNFTGSFNISARYCAGGSTLQFLTHGIGFDKSYWDFRVTPNDTQYSYTATALADGYSTLAWDRIGCGLSSAPDPYLDVQAPIELAILAQLTGMLRKGQLPVPVPQKVIHVGHSLGSELTNALAALPNANQLTDGVVLTAFSGIFNYTSLFVASASFHVAKTNQPARFGNRSAGYLTWGDKFANQYAFLEYPYFDPAALEYAESTKWPTTVGEFLTQPLLKFTARNFTGPVLWLPAQHDIIFCGGVCDGLFGPDSVALKSFPASKNVEVYIQPNVGHGINLHKNATGAYNVVQSWVKKQGF